MPNRAGSTRPDDTAPLLAAANPEPDDAPIRWIQRRGSWLWFGEREPGTRRRFGYGDLVEGGGAVAALLGMVAIDVSPWLAVPLAVATYIAIALLRPARERRDETVEGVAAEHPRIEEMAGDHEVVQFPEPAPVSADPVATRFGLTRREMEVLPLLAQRLTDREIAERLSISHRTAMNHTANILGKLGLASRRDVAHFVARNALPSPSASHEGSE